MISFIVPAHNEEAWVGRCVSAIRSGLKSLGEPYEIIVVDDASSDATASIARQQGAQVIRVKHRQIAATRNAGARQAHGDIREKTKRDERAHRVKKRKRRIVRTEQHHHGRKKPVQSEGRHRHRQRHGKEIPRSR